MGIGTSISPSTRRTAACFGPPQAGGADYDYPYTVEGLPDGSFIVQGRFSATATFGSGQPSETVVDSPSHDVFLAKYDADGALVWVRQTLSIDHMALGADISLSEDGSILALARIQGGVCFIPGDLSQMMFVSNLDNEYDLCLAKYNPDGSVAWAERLAVSHEAGSDITGQVAACEDGGAYVVGHFRREVAVVGGPLSTVLTPAVPGVYETFVAKYNAVGVLEWVKRVYGSGRVEIDDCRTAPGEDGVLVVGSFQGVATFGAGEPNETSLNAGVFGHMYLAKFNCDGTLAWAKQAAGEEGFTCGELTLTPRGKRGCGRTAFGNSDLWRRRAERDGACRRGRAEDIRC